MRLAIGLILVATVLCAPMASAQSYSFSIPEMQLNVYVQPDASVRLQYDILFECEKGAHPIDVVDVGLPHSGYEIANMSAALDGVPLRTIRKSTAISCGVEVPLPQPIAGGQRGRFTFEATMPNLVYQDTTRADYASLQITPTWFDGDYLKGTTNLGIVIYLPKDIKPEELLHQGQPYTRTVALADYTAAAWYIPNTRMDRPHRVGLSFPKRNMNRVVHMTRLGLLYKWWKDSPDVRGAVGLGLLIMLGIIFFRATAGTGCSCFVVLVLLAVVGFGASPALELMAIPVLPVLWYFTEKALRRRRGRYLPAIASVEGGGIKRGLTAPEAAVLLELPLGRVLALVIFGLLKKGVVEQVDASPLRVVVKPEFQGKTRSERRRAAANTGTVLHSYEQPFLDALLEAGPVPVEDIDFRDAMKQLIKQTADRMAGFDLEKTRSYYRSIVMKAWMEAKEIGDINQRTAYTDENLLWLLLDDRYDEQFEWWGARGYRYDPPWVRGPVIMRGVPGPAPAPSPGTPVGGRTTFSDVASSFAGWSENVASGLAAKLDGVSVGLTKGGVIDLSGVDRVTMEALKEMGSASGGGGGGCACAGCACACACAGGGR